MTSSNPPAPASAPGNALATEAIVNAGLNDLFSVKDRFERARILAGVVHAVFSDYYQRSRDIPYLAKHVFEARDWPRSFQLSRDRLAIYGRSTAKLAPVVRAGAPELFSDEALWSEVEAAYLSLIAGRYEADLAFAFLQSVRRKVFADEWRPVTYAGASGPMPPGGLQSPVLVSLAIARPVSPSTAHRLFDIPGLDVPWANRNADAVAVAQAIEAALSRIAPGSSRVLRLVMINAGFYRNRGAYIVGRICVPDHGFLPIAVALLNPKEGVSVDAVLTDSDELQFVFSTALANFHVTNPHYHELAQFLFSIMPKRPLGLHYATIGFNHVGKVAVLNEMLREHRRTGERLSTAVGFRGTVAIGFSMASSRYVAKIIRDTPTSGYKWGAFAGVGAVLDKYRLVHDSDRAGSMLDNIIYYNVTLDRSLFDEELLAELAQEAGGTVRIEGEGVLFRHLIVQMKVVPLPVFLATASPGDARAAVLNLGDCIKNNAAANIFNRDLDGRNYGVSRILKVYLFDYDAVEPLTGVKIRTNAGRVEGEEDIPDWYFETGTVFLPEEMMSGLRIDDRDLRRAFAQAHGDLLSVDYWEGMQRALLDGRVPRVRSYPEARRLRG